MKRSFKKILSFCLIIISVFTLFVFSTCVSAEPLPDYPGDKTLSFWWDFRNIGFSRPDFILYENGLRQPFDWETEGDVAPLRFDIVSDGLGNESVSLSLVAIGQFFGQGYNSYSTQFYDFIFDLHLVRDPLELLTSPINFRLVVEQFCGYSADALVDLDNTKIYTFGSERVEMSSYNNFKGVIFDCVGMTSSTYRVQVSIFPTAPVEFYLAGIEIVDFYRWNYDPTIDGVFVTPNTETFDSFKENEQDLISSTSGGISALGDTLLQVVNLTSFLRQSLLSATTIFNRLILNWGSLKHLLEFSFAVGLMSSVLAIGYGIASSFNSKGSKPNNPKGSKSSNMKGGKK